MSTEEKLNELFLSLGRTKKVEFIDQNIQYASASAVAEFVETYIYDVLEDVGDKEMIADFLRDNGYNVEKAWYEKGRIGY